LFCARVGFVHERDVISDEMWAVIEPLLPRAQGAGRPWSDHRLTVEGVAWRFRTGAPWRDLPERFGRWNTVYKTFDRWASDGHLAADPDRGPSPQRRGR